MKSPTSTPASGGDPAKFAQACLEHLEQEERHLRATRAALEQMRDAILHGDLTTIAHALEGQDQAAHAGQELAVRRELLQHELAERLGVAPEHASLQAIADVTPAPLGEQLADRRQAIRRLALEVDLLNRQNAALIQHSSQFLQQFLVEITGGEPVTTRYGPSGTFQEPVCGSLLSARG